MVYKVIKAFLFYTVFLHGQNQDMPIDGIAAIVGENIILKSDVSQVVGLSLIHI